EEHHDQLAELGAGVEQRTALDEQAQLLACAQQHVDLELETALDFLRDSFREPRAIAHGALEHDIAALENGTHAAEAERAIDRLERPGRQAAMAPDVDASQQRNVDRHVGDWPPPCPSSASECIGRHA